MLRILIYFIFVFTGLLAEAQTQASILGRDIGTGALCPEAPQGFLSQCIQVPASRKKAMGSLRLYIEIYGRFDQQKPTLLFLNGGPGGSTDQFTGINEIFSVLAPQYNLVFFDPRGVGKSKLASGQNTDFEKAAYTTEENIQDIESVRRAVLGRKPVILVGHSYGAHLALGYASLFPEKASHVIAMNGALDEMGFLLQSYEKQKVLEKSTAHLNPADLTQLFTILQAGKAVSSRGEPVSLAEFMGSVFGLLSTYKGQTKELPDLFVNYIQRLVRPNPVAESTNSAPKMEVFGLEMPINTYIVCHDLMPQKRIDVLKNSEIKAAAQLGKDSICPQSPVRHSDRGFDFKTVSKNISSRIMLIGGTHDPLIPIAVQERDFQILKNYGKPVSFLRMQNVGHNPLSESPDCTWPNILSFLKNEEMSNQLPGCSLAILHN